MSSRFFKRTRLVPTSNFRKKRGLHGYGFVLPAMCWMGLFTFTPLVMSLIRVFQDYGTGEFIGFDNFDYVLKTPAFLQSLGNVVVMTLIITVLMTVLSFLFALLLSKIESPRLSNLLKSLIYLPNLLSGLIVTIILNMLINEGYGLFAAIRISNNQWPIHFTTEGIWPYISIIVPSVWVGLGYNTLVMLAGILNIPKDYIEAARIDGANNWQVLTRIYLPCMRNYFVLTISTQITGGLQMLEIPMWVTGGGPNNKTLTPALWLFNTFRDSGRSPNIAIPGSIIIMLIIVGLNLISFSILRSKKLED